jgi:hypothetical protein
LKYYGLIDSIPLNRSLEDFSKYHLLSGATSFCFHLHDKNRITEEIYTKLEGSQVQYPILPFCHSHK